MKDKHELRKSMLMKRLNLSEINRQIQNVSIAEHLYNEKSFVDCKVLFIYISVKDEIATIPIISHALSLNKIVCVPKCISRGIMEAFQINSLSDLTEGKYKIPEPLPNADRILPQSIDLCIIPSLCCDLNGYRLGYGGGYYDRYLKKIKATKIALCSAERLVKQIPIEEHDIKCDKIITENGVMSCS